MRGGAKSPPFLTRKAERSIDHDPRHGLTIALTHQPGFVQVDDEAFLRDDPVHDRPKFVGGGSIHLSGESQIVGVTGVNQSALFRQASQTMVQAEQQCVANSGTGWGTLDAMALTHWHVKY